MRARSTLPVAILVPLLAACASKSQEFLYPHTIEFTDDSGERFPLHPVRAEEDSVTIYADEEELFREHPNATAACWFGDQANFVIRHVDLTRNSWEQERTFQFVKDRTEVARESARLCGADVLYMRQTRTVVPPQRVFYSQTGRIRWINGRERVVLEWFAYNTTSPENQAAGQGP